MVGMGHWRRHSLGSRGPPRALHPPSQPRSPCATSASRESAWRTCKPQRHCQRHRDSEPEPARCTNERLPGNACPHQAQCISKKPRARPICNARSILNRDREYLIGKALTEETYLPIRSYSRLLTISSSNIVSLLCLEVFWKRKSHMPEGLFISLSTMQEIPFTIDFHLLFGDFLFSPSPRLLLIDSRRVLKFLWNEGGYQILRSDHTTAAR